MRVTRVCLRCGRAHARPLPVCRDWKRAFFGQEGLCGDQAKGHGKMRLEDLRVLVYEVRVGRTAFEQVRLERRAENTWVVACCGDVMTIDGRWEWEPSPSNRDYWFIQKTRFPSAEAALLAFERFDFRGPRIPRCGE